jgi:hypothetical protein
MRDAAVPLRANGTSIPRRPFGRKRRKTEVLQAKWPLRTARAEAAPPADFLLDSSGKTSSLRTDSQNCLMKLTISGGTRLQFVKLV